MAGARVKSACRLDLDSRHPTRPYDTGLVKDSRKPCGVMFSGMGIYIDNLPLHQPPQYRQQNAAIFVVGHVDGAIQARDGLEGEG